MFKTLITAVLALFAAAAFAAVDVNTGTQAQLEAVKGIGPAMSTKLLAERQKGAFKDWPDLASRVSGIGDKRAAKLSTAGLTVGGAAFNGEPLPGKAGKSGKAGRSGKADRADKAEKADKSSKASKAAATPAGT